jgi:hypothetical protein
VNGGYEANAGSDLLDARCDSVSHPVIANADDNTVANICGQKRMEIFVTPDHLIPKYLDPGRFEVIEESNDAAVAFCLQYVDDNSRVS